MWGPGPTSGTARRLDTYRVSPTLILSTLFRAVWRSGSAADEINASSDNQERQLVVVTSMRVCFQRENDERCKSRSGTHHSGLVGQLMPFVCADKRQVFRTSNDERLEDLSKICKRELIAVGKQWREVLNL